MPLSVDLGDHAWPKPATSSCWWAVGFRNCPTLPSILPVNAHSRFHLHINMATYFFPSVNTLSLPHLEIGRVWKKDKHSFLLICKSQNILLTVYQSDVVSCHTGDPDFSRVVGKRFLPTRVAQRGENSLVSRPRILGQELEMEWRKEGSIQEPSNITSFPTLCFILREKIFLLVSVRQNPI